MENDNTEGKNPHLIKLWDTFTNPKKAIGYSIFRKIMVQEKVANDLFEWCSICDTLHNSNDQARKHIVDKHVKQYNDLVRQKTNNN